MLCDNQLLMSEVSGGDTGSRDIEGASKWAKGKTWYDASGMGNLLLLSRPRSYLGLHHNIGRNIGIGFFK